MASDLLCHCRKKDQERSMTDSPWDLQSSELYKYAVNQNLIYIAFFFKNNQSDPYDIMTTV